MARIISNLDYLYVSKNTYQILAECTAEIWAEWVAGISAELVAGSAQWWLARRKFPQKFPPEFLSLFAVNSTNIFLLGNLGFQY